MPIMALINLALLYCAVLPYVNKNILPNDFFNFPMLLVNSVNETKHTPYLVKTRCMLIHLVKG